MWVGRIKSTYCVKILLSYLYRLPSLAHQQRTRRRICHVIMRALRVINAVLAAPRDTALQSDQLLRQSRVIKQAAPFRVQQRQDLTINI
jgi:hypothetical protein